MKNILDSMAISFDPEEAIAFLSGVYDTLIVFQPSERVQAYKGRILVHVLGYPSHPELLKGCEATLRAFDVDPQDVPAYSLMGWLNVDKVFKYDQISFAADNRRHGCGTNLAKYQAECGLEGYEAWGIRLSQGFVLDPPVTDVLPPEAMSNGDLWLAVDPIALAAFKLALTAAREEEGDEEGEE